MRAAALLTWVITAAACSGPTSAIGYRARQAVLQRDTSVFPELMEEAAASRSAEDDPRRTVITHFLDLADHPDFLPLMEGWRAKGWIDDDLSCSIDRAVFRARIDAEPARAWEAADRCVDRARAAAGTPARHWEIEECLGEAPFLIATSTASLVRYLRIAIDPDEPLELRTGLLDGMSRVYLSGAARLAGNTGKEQQAADREAARNAADQSARLRWLIGAVRDHIEAPLLSRATGRGALELENVLVPLGRSFIASFSQSSDPYEQELAWGWVRAIKEKKRIERIAALGLWNRSKEGKRDSFWYLCATRDAPANVQGGVLGPVQVIEAIAVRAKSPSEDREKLRAERCKPKPDADALPAIYGPFPLETTARAALIESLIAADARSSASVRIMRVEKTN